LTQKPTNLAKLSSDLQQVAELDFGFKYAVSKIAEISQAHVGWNALLILTIERFTSSFVTVYKQGPDNFFELSPNVHPIRGMLAAQIINTGEPVVIESAIQATAPDPEVSVRHMFEQGANSIILSPIFRDEKIVGVLSAISDRAKHFSAEAVKSIDIVCDALGRALEQVDKDAPFVSSYTDTTIHQAIL
jgi:transcriptional regulator with GAF, ATPase, and Fis domain